MTSLVRRSAIATALASMVFAGAAAAQVKFELGATIGLYSPMGSFEQASVHSMQLPNTPDMLSGAALGAQLRLWVAPRIGFELAGTTVSNSFNDGASPEAGSYVTQSRISTGTAQLLFRVTGDDSRARIWLGAGGGAIQHGGDAYAPFGRPVNYGGVVGVGSAIRISGGLSADVGVSSLIYNLDIRGNAATDPGLSERGTQVDMLLRTGLSYSWH